MNNRGFAHVIIVLLFAVFLVLVGSIFLKQEPTVTSVQPSAVITTIPANQEPEKAEKKATKPIEKCTPTEVTETLTFEEEKWTYLTIPQINLEFEYPVQAGKYTYNYTNYETCDFENHDPTGEKFEWVYRDENSPTGDKNHEIAGAVSNIYSAGREGWYTDIVDLIKEDDKYIFKSSHIIFFENPYLTPLATFKTKYNTDVVLVDVYEFHKNIDQIYASIFKDKEGDKLLIVKLPENDSNFKAFVIYLPSWVDNATANRITQSITLQK